MIGRKKELEQLEKLYQVAGATASPKYKFLYFFLK